LSRAPVEMQARLAK